MKLSTSFSFTDKDIPDDIVEEIADCISEKLSEKTGFCHQGFFYKIKIDVFNVHWDIDEY